MKKVQFKMSYALTYFTLSIPFFSFIDEKVYISDYLRSIRDTPERLGGLVVQGVRGVRAGKGQTNGGANNHQVKLKTILK